MKSIFSVACVGMIALANAQDYDMKKLAKSYNHHRVMCNAATDLPDGIQERKKDMTTKIQYKTELLGDCNDEVNTPEQKLKCIEGNVWLKVGKVNYVNYVGTRRQSNTCNKLKGINGCDNMCGEFFQFWSEPEEGDCDLVKKEWTYECQLRVQLIAEKAASQWDAADITQGKLDGLFPDLEPVWAPVQVKPKKIFNPWLAAQKTMDLGQDELTRLRNAFGARKTPTNKCSLLVGWYDRKKELLEMGFKRNHQLLEVKDWHDNVTAMLDEFHSERKATIKNNKVFYNQSESEVQKAYTEASVNVQAAMADNRSDYALFLSQNDRKRISLYSIAEVKCTLGSGVCYDATPTCDLLRQFYLDQQAGIARLRHISEAMIRDYRSMVGTDAQNAMIKSDWQAKIDDNLEILKDEVANIRAVYDGQDEARMVADRTRAIENENQAYWREYLRIESRQQAIVMKLWTLEQELEEKIRAYIESGKIREYELLSSLI